MTQRKVLQIRLDSKTAQLVDMVEEKTGKSRTEIVKAGIRMLAADVVAYSPRG